MVAGESWDPPVQAPALRRPSRRARRRLARGSHCYMGRPCTRGDIRNPRAWLLECTWKQAKNYRRKQQSRDRLRAESTVVESAERALEARQDLRLALGSLNESLREIVLKARYDDLELEDIAEARNVQKHQVSHLLKRSVARMRHALQREEAKVTKRRAMVFPLLLARFFDSLRSSSGGVPLFARVTSILLPSGTEAPGFRRLRRKLAGRPGTSVSLPAGSP